MIDSTNAQLASWYRISTSDGVPLNEGQPILIYHHPHLLGQMHELARRCIEHCYYQGFPDVARHSEWWPLRLTLLQGSQVAELQIAGHFRATFVQLPTFCVHSHTIHDDGEVRP